MGPWEAALGDSFSQLHPLLRDYFRTIAPGSVGRGRGVFSVVGTPRRWLWPILAVLGSEGIIFPGLDTNVPFTVENRPVYSGLAATRRFQFPRGDRVMVDHAVLTSRGLEDRLGRHGWVVAKLEPTVSGGMLTLRSVEVRLCGIILPKVLAPRVTVTERIDDERRQVSMTLDAPGIGRLYEYAGTFDYAVEHSRSSL